MTEVSECIGCCSEALTVHMTSLECSAEEDALSGDELESAAGDLDDPTDTDTESISDGTALSAASVLHKTVT